MSAEQKGDRLQELRQDIASGTLTQERAIEIKNDYIGAGMNVKEYLEFTVDFGEIALIDGIYRFTEDSAKRDRIDITKKVLELRQILNDSTKNSGTPERVIEIVTTAAKLQTILWLQGKSEDL